MDEFEYVTEMKPEEPPPPPRPLSEVAWRRTALGALGGLGFLGWETAVDGWLGVQPAAGVRPIETLLAYAITGALFGGIAGLLRLRDGAWALVAMSLAVAWLLAGHIALLMIAGGVWLVIPILFALAVVLGYFAGARRLEDPTSGAIASALFLCLAVLLPVDTRLLLTPFSTSGLMWNAWVTALAAAVGGLVGMVLADEVIGMGWVLGTAAIVSWLAAVPVLRLAAAAWPLASRTVGPPIVLIVASGLRADHLGTYGYVRPTSPHLDAAAARGLVYGDATTAAPWTLPAMASLLTGRLPSHHAAGIGRYSTHRPLGKAPPYVPELLSQRGYVTVGITTEKWLTAPFGFDRGFDVYDDRTGPAFVPAALHPWTVIGFGPTWPDHRDARVVTDRALSFVHAEHGGSWFLLVHYADLLFDPTADPKEVAALGTTRGPLVDGYDAGIHRLDAQIGRLLDALPPDARVILTASYGMELNEQRGQDAPPGVRWGHSLYQEVVHVPLVVIAPGLAPTWVSRPVSLVDVAPTIAWLGGADPKGMDGEVLWEVHHTASVPTAPQRPIVVEAVRWGMPEKAARLGRYKLVKSEDGTERLYDLEVDPAERAPILQRPPALQAEVRELEALLPPFSK